MPSGEFHQTPEEIPPRYEDLPSARIAKDAMLLNEPGLINPILNILRDRARNDPFNEDLALYVKHVETWRDDLLRIREKELQAAQIAQFDEVMIGFTMPIDRKTAVHMDKIERDALDALARDTDE